MIYRLILPLREQSDHAKAHQCRSTGDHYLCFLSGTRRTIRDPGRAQLRLHRGSRRRPPPDPCERCRRRPQERATVCGRRVLLVLGQGDPGWDGEQDAAGFGSCSSFLRACSTTRGRTAQVPARPPTSKLGAYARLISPTMTRRMIAPTSAAMIDPISPPAAMPNRPNNQPQISEPITPTTILPTRPKPTPFMITPASHPATAPISKKMMRPVSVMCFDLLRRGPSRSPLPYVE